MLKCSCGKKLRKKRGRDNVYQCSCGCVYSLVIVKKCNKCGNKGLEKLSLREIRKQKRNKRKRR